MGLTTTGLEVSGSRKTVKVPRSLRRAIIFNLVMTLALLPVAGQPFDVAGLTGAAGAWLRWGVSPFYHWKFGADLTVLSVGAQGLAFVLEHLGMGGSAALTTAWKLPLVGANVLTGLVLYDIANRLDARRPTLAPLLWLVSPVPVFVAAGFGDVEPLTVLAFVLATDLVLRRRFLVSGLVIGLGVGVEYLPLLVLVVVTLAVGTRLITRREAASISVTALGTIGACFLPTVLTSTGSSSLLAGLRSSAAATSVTQNSVVGARSSSLWLLLGNLSPGRYWVIVGGAACLAAAGALAFRARHRGGNEERQSYFVLGGAMMMVIVVLLDPGALPQFSDLAFGGLCLLSLVISIPPWGLVAGPFLQLLTGLVWVYGGSFESFWYDMWVSTGNAGWQLPQSARVATWAGIVGVAIIVYCLAGGLILTKRNRRSTRRAPYFALSIGCAGSLFFAVWSAQPAYWQGVGPHGPAVLPGFASLTASQNLPVRHGRTSDMVAIPRDQWPLPKMPKRTLKPYLSLAIRLKSLATPAGVGYARPLPHHVNMSIGSLATGSKVRSLWVEALLGRTSWTSPSTVDRGVAPVLRSNDHTIHEASSTWVTRDWVEFRYKLPVQPDVLNGHLGLSLRGQRGTRWNGSLGRRWLAISVRAMSLRIVVNGRVVDTRIVAPSPAPYRPIERAEVSTGLPLKRRLTVQVPAGQPGDPAVEGASLQWPLSVPVDARTGSTMLMVIGVAYAVMIVGGSAVGGRWVIARRGRQAVVSERPDSDYGQT